MRDGGKLSLELRWRVSTLKEKPETILENSGRVETLEPVAYPAGDSLEEDTCTVTVYSPSSKMSVKYLE